MRTKGCDRRRVAFGRAGQKRDPGFETAEDSGGGRKIWRSSCARPRDAGEFEMKRNRRAFGAAGMLLVSVLTAAPAAAPKQGGILRMDLRNSPPSLSILEESDFVQAWLQGSWRFLVGYQS